MTRILRGGYVFLTWSADHPPRHVHVLRHERMVLKWDLVRRRALQGVTTRRLTDLLRQLEDEGRL